MASFMAGLEGGKVWYSSGKKRRAQKGGKGGGDAAAATPGAQEGLTVQRGLRNMLATVRRLESEIEDTYIFEKDDTVMDFLQKASDIHAAHKPASGPHPLGAPRHLVLAAWIEGCVQRYENNKVLKQEALKIFKSLDILDHFKKLLVAITIRNTR